MSNKKKKKKKERTRSIERTIIPLFLRIYLSSPLRFLQSFPTIFVHHFSLSLSSFPPPSSFFFLVENIGRAIEAS